MDRLLLYRYQLSFPQSRICQFMVTEYILGLLKCFCWNKHISFMPLYLQLSALMHSQLMHIQPNQGSCVTLSSLTDSHPQQSVRCHRHIISSFFSTTPRSCNSSLSLWEGLAGWFWSSGKKPELIDYRSLLIKSICNAAVVIQSPHASSWWPFSLHN